MVAIIATMTLFIYMGNKYKKMRKFDADEHVQLYFRCLIDQINLIESCYIDGNISEEKCHNGLLKFYEIMSQINDNLKSNKCKTFNPIFLGQEGNC
jgi:hypothetical protein